MDRRPLLIAAPGATLAGVLHPGERDTGILIVAGAPQTRAGAHRGFVQLADALAARGFPVLRFDRRGSGDSDGDDPGFRHIAADIAAARATLLSAGAKRIVGIGLCDGAAALALDPGTFAGLLLLNPWTRDSDSAAAMPPRAAIAARYRARFHPFALARRALRGDLDIRRALRGLRTLARAEPVPQTARRMAAALASYRGGVRIVLGGRDATGQAFAALWQSPLFKAARARAGRELVTLPHATHTFAGAAEAAAVAAAAAEFADACSR